MEINYYRKPVIKGEQESWQDCQFTTATDLSALTVKPLVTINGQPILRQHHSTYLTGKDTCRAHHFAKFLAATLLPTGKVLWIDSLHGPHVCKQIYQELVAHATIKDNLHFVCLDMLGGLRDNVYAISRNIEALIGRFKPALVVIDDIDHLMPFCGINIASEFCRIVRDVTNHTDTSFLFIGYNHLSKKASTTGNLGKYLFLDATDVFSISTQREVTTVRLVRSYDLSRNPDDTQYTFAIGPDNLPHEACTKPLKQDEDRETQKEQNNNKQLESQDRQVQLQDEPQDELQEHQEHQEHQEQHQQGTPSDIPEGRDSGTSPIPNPLIPNVLNSTINNSLTLPPHHHPIQ